MQKVLFFLCLAFFFVSVGVFAKWGPCLGGGDLTVRNQEFQRDADGNITGLITRTEYTAFNSYCADTQEPECSESFITDVVSYV